MVPTSMVVCVTYSDKRVSLFFFYTYISVIYYPGQFHSQILSNVNFNKDIFNFLTNTLKASPDMDSLSLNVKKAVLRVMLEIRRQNQA